MKWPGTQAPIVGRVLNIYPQTGMIQVSKYLLLTEEVEKIDGRNSEGGEKEVETAEQREGKRDVSESVPQQDETNDSREASGSSG